MREVIMRLTPKEFEDAEHAEILQELVRCKNCKRNHTEECSMWYESDDHQEQYSWNKPDDFCSYGERKEVEECQQTQK